MSYLELAKQAEARLRTSRETQPGYERNDFTKNDRGAHVAEALPFLGMPLDEFARRGASLEVRVPWLEVTLWMVPTDRDGAQLVAKGIRRGRIWTAGELIQLMQIARIPETVETVTHAKLEMDGEITEVRRGDDSAGG